MNSKIDSHLIADLSSAKGGARCDWVQRALAPPEEQHARVAAQGAVLDENIRRRRRRPPRPRVEHGVAVARAEDDAVVPRERADVAVDDVGARLWRMEALMQGYANQNAGYSPKSTPSLLGHCCEPQTVTFSMLTRVLRR